MGLMSKFGTNKPARSVPSGLVTISRSDPVAVIRMNNAAHSNVLTRNLTDQLTQAFESINGEDDVRCVVLAGEGVDFSAGPSLEEMAAFTKSDAQKYWKAGKLLTDAIEEARQPVICAIQGHCLSFGFALALACDILLLADNARLAFPDIRHVQLMPGWGATQRLVHKIGSQAAKYLLITGATLSAEDALKHGLAHDVVQTNQLEVEARELATRIAAGPLSALSRVKHSTTRGVDVEHGTAMLIEEQDWLESWDVPNRKEIIIDARERINIGKK